MIQAVMLVILGFLVASLLGLLIAPALWSRAARLTRRRIESTLPISLNEIDAAQDRVRATYAVRLRRLETALSRAKQKAALQLVDNSRLQMQLAGLKDSIHGLGKQLDERRNAATVFEQTIKKRFPELEGTVSGLRAELSDRSVELQDLHNKLKRRDEQLDIAQRQAQTFESEIASLREAMEKASSDRSGRRLRKPSQWSLDDYRSEYDRLNLELSKLRQQLAHAQDRESHQVALVRGELQKLSEVILVASAPAAIPAPQPSRIGDDRLSARIGAPSSGREVAAARPIPWVPEPAPQTPKAPDVVPPIAASGDGVADTRPPVPAGNAGARILASARTESQTPPPSAQSLAALAKAAQSVPAMPSEPRPLISQFGPSPAPADDGAEAMGEAATRSPAGDKSNAGRKPGVQGAPEGRGRAPLGGNGRAKASAAAPAFPIAEPDITEDDVRHGADLPARPERFPVQALNGNGHSDVMDEPGPGDERAVPPPVKPFADARDLRAISELLTMNRVPKDNEKVQRQTVSSEIVREARQGVIIDGEAEAALMEADPAAENADAEKPARRSLLDRLRSVPEGAEAAEK